VLRAASDHSEYSGRKLLSAKSEAVDEELHTLVALEVADIHHQ
jgi:hypothetical protein